MHYEHEYPAFLHRSWRRAAEGDEPPVLDTVNEGVIDRARLQALSLGDGSRNVCAHVNGHGGDYASQRAHRTDTERDA